MYYTIYKVTNKINGKIYIGMHKTNNLDDGYMGSGKYLNFAMNKHGIENFEKEILHVFDNKKDMHKKEVEIVNEEFVAENNTYNLKIGGFGGWDYANENHNNKNNHRKTGNYGFKIRPEYTIEFRKKISNGCKGNTNFKDKQHTKETISKMKEIFKKNKHQQGNKNSQYGSMWITNGKINKKLPKDNLIPQGWKKGRVIKL